MSQTQASAAAVYFAGFKAVRVLNLLGLAPEVPVTP